MAETASSLLFESLAEARIVDLGRPLFQGMPQSMNHPPFRHSLPRRHGDKVRVDGGSAANDLIVMGTHVGTHIDALSHVSHDGLLHGGISASEAQTGGRFSQLGVETVAPFVCRGVLLDVAAARGEEACPAAHEVTVEEMATAAEGLDLAAADVILVRTGWGRFFDEPDRFIGEGSGVPGPGEDGARWLASFSPRAVGSDTIAFERIPAGTGHAVLPAHRVLLVGHGIHIIETLDLEELAASGAREFVFILSPLKILGGTGSPVRPLAVLA